MDNPNVIPSVPQSDPPKPPEAAEADDDLEYEENALIKFEQKALLASRRPGQPRSPPRIIYPPVADAPFLDLFIEQFINAFAPDTRDDCGTSSAIRRAGSVRMFSPLLSVAFKAVAMANFGQTTGSQRVTSQGEGLHRQTLTRLQEDLFDPTQSRSEGVFATVVLLLAYESIQHTSDGAMINHLVGAMKLIEFRNPWNHRFGVEHLCFTELLPCWVSTAIIMRQPSFLSRKEWKTVPWSVRGGPKDIMEHLLEQVVDLPAILWRYDKYKVAIRAGSTPPDELNNQLIRLWASAAELETRLRRWKSEKADTYPAGQPSEVDYQDADSFPILRYTDPLTLTEVTPPTLVYPDPQLARTLCMYYAAMSVLKSVDTRSAGTSSGSERLEFARLICRSMEYYIRAVPGNLVNRMAFPLRVAYDTLPEWSLERRFIADVFSFVERKNALRSWGKFLPGLSTRLSRKDVNLPPYQTPPYVED